MDWVSVIVAPAVIAAIVSVAASGVAGIARRREERRAWLRDTRHATYADMIDAGRQLAQVMQWTGPYDEHPQPLARAYDKWMTAAASAQFLAGPRLQVAVQNARFAATRYHETRKPYARFHYWINDVESAARSELGLPDYAGWDRLSVSIGDVLGRVDEEDSAPPEGSPPHWTTAREDDTP